MKSMRMCLGFSIARKKYNACGVPVYFVKSEEYEPKKGKKGKS